MDGLFFDKSKNKKRWLGYLDFLGTKSLIKSKLYTKIFKNYKKAIDETQKYSLLLEELNYFCFSDTFIFYTETKSLSGFNELEHRMRWFFYFLIESNIPVRGAISFGTLYADENKIFFGDALIDAYEYGESQNWIGLVLCKSAEEYLLKHNQLPNYFIKTEIPYRKNISKLEKRLFACVIGAWIKYGNKYNPIVDSLISMRNESEKYKDKYKNTLDFLRSNISKYTPEIII